MSEPWWPENWRELPVAPYPSNLPRDIYQLDANGDPWNTSWCAEDIAPLVFPAGTWAISPMWVPPAQDPPASPDPV